MTTFPAFESIREAIARSPFRRQAEESLPEKLDAGQRYLVALSGGPDSVAMAVLLWSMGYRIGCAHMNYHLRGRDSDGDEEFCRALCRELNVPAFFRSVRLKDDFKDSRKSCQELARDLRYAFFEELVELEGFDFVITAHHLDDSIETFFNNLIRGTGIEGLTGIPMYRGHILRPFLTLRKEDILSFLNRFSIPYREDVSNEGVDYLRNQVRHMVIPACTEGNDSFFQVMEKNMERLQAVHAWLLNQVDDWKQKFYNRADGSDQFLRSGFSPDTPITLIYQIFKVYGFQWSEIAKIKDLLTGQPGKLISSKSHTLLVDREKILVRKKEDKTMFTTFVLQRKELIDGARFSVSSGSIDVRKDRYEGASISHGKNGMCIPEKDLEFPLTIRRWRPGDRFQPSGMAGKHQKVSDFLTHLKLDRFRKQEVLVLTDRNRILWVIGYRCAELSAEGQPGMPCVCFIYHPG